MLDRVAAGYDAAPVISDVSLRIGAGQFAGLVGPSGAGKTSVLRAMLGDLPWQTGAVTVNGLPVTPGRAPAGVGYVPQVQTVDWTFPATVEDVVLMGRIQRMGRWPWPSRADRAAVTATLDQLGVGHLARRHIRDLSGGQQQRVFLARALIGDPAVLLLDEPTAGVDVATRETVLAELWRLNRRGVTIVVTTHELNAVAVTLPWVICFNRTVVDQGTPEDIFTEPVLGRTFGAPIRVLPDAVSGRPLVVEGYRAEPVPLAAD